MDRSSGVFGEVSKILLFARLSDRGNIFWKLGKTKFKDSSIKNGPWVPTYNSNVVSI